MTIVACSGSGSPVPEQFADRGRSSPGVTVWTAIGRFRKKEQEARNGQTDSKLAGDGMN